MVGKTNMASFQSIMEALEHEIRRQAECLRSGETVYQDTRLFDEENGITLPMRSKEDAPDYHYFPDPDLLEIKLDDAFMKEVKKELPEFPDQKAARLVRAYDISESDVLQLIRDKEVSDFFDTCAPLCEEPRRLAQWIVRELFSLLK